MHIVISEEWADPSKKKNRVFILNHAFHLWFTTLPMASGMKTLQDSSKDAKDKKHHESKDVKESKDEKSSSPHFPSMKLGRESSMWSWAFLQACLSETSSVLDREYIDIIPLHLDLLSLWNTFVHQKSQEPFSMLRLSLKLLGSLDFSYLWDVTNSQHPNIAMSDHFLGRGGNMIRTSFKITNVIYRERERGTGGDLTWPLTRYIHHVGKWCREVTHYKQSRNRIVVEKWGHFCKVASGVAFQRRHPAVT